MTSVRALDIAVSAARRAGEYLRGVARTASAGERIKESLHSIVTAHDIEAQKIIVTALREGDGEATIISEEMPEQDRGASDPPYWIVDPIDGTSYFARGLQGYSVSIALVDRQGLAVGVVHCPATNELFLAERGQGAFLNGDRITVSGITDPRRALLTFSHRFLREITSCPGRLEMVRSVRSIRGGGSCAQELAYLASGRIDGVIALAQSPWDYAAGMLLVTEAGGEISDAGGRRPDLMNVSAKSQDIVATNGSLHPWCLKHIQSRGQP